MLGLYSSIIKADCLIYWSVILVYYFFIPNIDKNYRNVSWLLYSYEIYLGKNVDIAEKLFSMYKHMYKYMMNYKHFTICDIFICHIGSCIQQQPTTFTNNLNNYFVFLFTYDT
jgi:hypothetical protein